VRFASVGNGRLLVTLDRHGRIVDFYFPYVGLENQTSGNPVRVAFWNGESLSLDEEWRSQVTYQEATNVVESRWFLEREKVEITAYTFVDVDEPVLYAVLKVLYNGEGEGRGKLFFVQDFNIYSNPYGDTAFYDPYTSSIIHYKSKRYVAVKMMSAPGYPVEFSASKGNPLDDLKDGKLDYNPISHGNVQSALGVELPLKPKAVTKLYYVMVASRNLEEVRRLLQKISPAQAESSFVSVFQFWRSWLSKGSWPSNHESWLYNVSLITVKNHMDVNGSIIASSDYSFVNIYGDAYQYCWPRDGALAAHALDVAGYGELAMRHFNFIRDVVSREGFLYHKYNPNRTLASSWHPWLYMGKRIYPIQEDETALEVWAIGYHYRKYRDLDELVEIYKGFVRPALNFMTRFVEDGLPKPSFDLWEERYGIHLHTVSSVYGGLVQGAELARGMGDESLAEDTLEVAKSMREQALKRLSDGKRFFRRLDENLQLDPVVDASMYSPYFFGMVNPGDPVMVNTVELILQRLTVNGGIARYEGDSYQRRKSSPNPWIITTLWVAEYLIDSGRKTEADPLINWVTKRATPSGLLPEQVDPETLESTSVLPLVWSHAEFVITLNKYHGKY
jgi:Glucoamylase and related glycosyl hydrolases